MTVKCWFAIIFFVVLGFFLVGCSSSRWAEDKTEAHIGGSGAPEASNASKGQVTASAPQAQDEDEKPIKLTSVADSEPDRYLIKNATLTLETREVRATTDKLVADARRLKGYVSDMHETVDGLGARSVTLQLRVPFSEFDGFLGEFEGLGKVLEREVTAQDVTEEFVDTQSKVHNLKATEERLLAHLSRTGKLSDTLLIEKEVNRVREEIDRLTGRLRFLAHRVAFSTFTVTVRETAHAQAITPPETYSVGKVVSDSARSLVGFGQQVLTIGIWLAMWSVIWLPPLVFWTFIVRRRRPTLPRNL